MLVKIIMFTALNGKNISGFIINFVQLIFHQTHQILPYGNLHECVSISIAYTDTTPKPSRGGQYPHEGTSRSYLCEPLLLCAELCLGRAPWRSLTLDVALSCFTALVFQIPFFSLAFSLMNFSGN